MYLLSCFTVSSVSPNGMFHVFMFHAFSIDLFFIKKSRDVSRFHPTAGPSSAMDFQGSDMDLYSISDVDVDEESNYDYIHAGYDIHDLDTVRTLTIITASV